MFGEEGNYIERWFEALRTDTKAFDNYFSHLKDTQHFKN